MLDLKWSRKAWKWDEVNEDSRARAAAVDAKLVVYFAEVSPCTYFSGPRPQMHIAETPNGDRFLVDTQGYNYARYAVRIPEEHVKPEMADIEWAWAEGYDAGFAAGRRME